MGVSLCAQMHCIVWHYMLRTVGIAKKWGKMKSSDPDKLCLTLHAMLRKAMDSFVHSEWLAGRHFS